jgi:hypothetical protein
VKDKGKCPRRGPRSRWEQQIMQDVSQKEGRRWQEVEGLGVELWEARNRWRGHSQSGYVSWSRRRGRTKRYSMLSAFRIAIPSIFKMDLIRVLHIPLVIIFIYNIIQSLSLHFKHCVFHQPLLAEH